LQFHKEQIFWYGKAKPRKLILNLDSEKGAKRPFLFGFLGNVSAKMLVFCRAMYLISDKY